MNNKNGYILLHRKIYESGDFNNILEVSVFIYLLCKASHKITEVVYRRKKIVLSRGEVCIAYQDLAKKFCVSVKRIRTIIKHFEKAQNLAVRRHKTINVYLIVKYDKYQVMESVKGSKKAQESADRTNNINKINTYTSNTSNIINMKKKISIDKSSIPTLKSLNKILYESKDEFSRAKEQGGQWAYDQLIKKRLAEENE